VVWVGTQIALRRTQSRSNFTGIKLSFTQNLNLPRNPKLAGFRLPLPPLLLSADGHSASQHGGERQQPPEDEHAEALPPHQAPGRCYSRPQKHIPGARQLGNGFNHRLEEASESRAHACFGMGQQGPRPVLGPKAPHPRGGGRVRPSSHLEASRPAWGGRLTRLWATLTGRSVSFF